MIRVNVEVNTKFWYKKIKNPNKYFSEKLRKISKIIPHIKGKNIIFTILLTNSLNMKKLNKKFRNRNKSTDVLSFPYFSSNNIKLSYKKSIYIGDIATCYEIINIRSKKNNFQLEFDKAWVHGFLHLFGYDHSSELEAEEMENLERKICVNLGFTDPYTPIN